VNVTEEQLERFWSKVDMSGECWEWLGTRQDGGYGQFSVNKRYQYAHRLSFELAHGEIPPKTEIDHVCHNRACVNPGHLRLATSSQNKQHPDGLTISNRSGFRGVGWIPSRNRWRAQVQHQKRIYFVGHFETAEAAGAAAVAKRLELFTHNDADRKAE
jgi:hypothetical protein